MCGINGIFNSSETNNINDRAFKMAEAIKHRGPDNAGLYVHDEKVAFSFRRLSIQDLSDSSNQPMHSSCGRFVLLFNGEIYNFKEIKSTLDYPFKTNGDTEVVLAAIIKLGMEGFLSIANGMFSIALFDKFKYEIFLARDRFGIKPLFYYYDGKKMVFSSEIKGILASGLIEAKFNYDAIDDYLAFRYVRDPYTFFELVLAVKPGRYLKFNKAMEIDEVVYWSIDYQSPIIKDVNENEQIINLKNLLENSVRYRLISDVPVGTYLSGGLDSSLITAIAANISNNPINTFITGFDELNEFYYARKVSESYSTKHLEILINKETYLNELENIIKFKDAPMAVPNEISLAQMSLELSKKIKVVLSGEGADEVFAGYGRIFKSGFDYDAMAIRTPFYKYFINRYEYTSREFRDKFILSSKNLRILSDEKYSLIINDLSKEDFISKFFIESHLPGLLYRLDSTTMLAGVEARVPFLDHNLVEYVFKNLNFNQKIKWKNNNQIPKTTSDKYSEIFDIPKAILKSVARSYLSDEIIYRKKMGFPVPLKLIEDDLLVIAYDILNDDSWLKIDEIDKIIEDINTEKNSVEVLLMIVSLQMFKNYYFSRDWRY